MKTVKQRVEEETVHLANGIKLRVSAHVPTKKSSNRYDARPVGFKDYAVGLVRLPEVGGIEAVLLLQVNSDEGEYASLVMDVMRQLNCGVSADDVSRAIARCMQSVSDNPEQTEEGDQS